MDYKPPVLILSGFLGSGKTTVLMQLIAHLRAKHGKEYRIAIIENEIGSASVDSSIIEDSGYAVTELLSGCVCCTLVGQLVPAIDKLVAALGPQLVILEATGVATPGSMRDAIARGGYDARILSLVDASRWKRIAVALSMLIEAQVEPADVLLINKCDLADQADIAEAEKAVREMNPTAPIVRASASSQMAASVIDVLLGE